MTAQEVYEKHIALVESMNDFLKKQNEYLHEEIKYLQGEIEKLRSVNASAGDLKESLERASKKIIENFTNHDSTGKHTG